MKQFKIIMIVIAFVLLLPTAAKTADSPQTGSITVTADGFGNDDGEADIALVNTPESFKSMKIAPFMGARIKINGQKVEYTFKNVPYGDYAVKMFHDENRNGNLDKTGFGTPTEEYGFSNNVRSSFGMPKYEKAKFTLDSPNMTLKITVK